MVRTYQRKTTQASWSEVAMEKAVAAVRAKEMGLRRASNAFGVPQTSLQRRVSSTKSAKEASRKTLGRYKPIFTIQQENELKEYIMTMENRLFGLTILDLRSLAFQYAKRNKIPNNFSEEDELAGKDWVHNFLKRNPTISLRTPENTSVARAQGFNKITVTKFFELLGNLMDKHKFPPGRIYNCDETGISTVPNRRSKVLSLKGKKQVGVLSSAERGTLVTSEICFSAAGHYVPPLLIFPRVRRNPLFEQGLPPETKVECHPSGWMQSEIFAPIWFQHFLQHTRPSVEDPVLLILDGHATHVKNLELVEMARQNNVHILVIPPHTSHRLQPLDVAFMAPLSTYYEQGVRTWLRNNPGKCITVHDVGPIFGEAYMKSATLQTALNAFKNTGISPFNAHIFPDHVFAASETTNREITDENRTGPDENSITEQNSAVSETSASRAEPVMLTSRPTTSNSPPPSALNDEPSSVTTPTHVPLPHVSPADIRPFPTVQNDGGGPRRKIKRGKTMVLTATPNMEELKATKKKIPDEPKLKQAKRQLVNVFSRKRTTREVDILCDDEEEYSSSFSLTDSDAETSSEITFTTTNTNNLKVNDFVQVKLKLENTETSKEYIGQILKINILSNMIQVSFMRPYRQHKDIFVFPDVQDISMVEKHEIIGKLTKHFKLRHGQLKFT